MTIVIYSRAGCHLCEDAERLIESRQSTTPFELRIIDIDADPALAARYSESVPVVLIDGVIRFRGSVSPVLFDRFLGGSRP